MRVMVIGASNDRNKFGNKAFRAYRAQGHDVIPVNPNEPAVEGMPTVPSVLNVQGHVDRALVYIPAGPGVRVMSELGQRVWRGDTVDEVWLNPGADSQAVIDAANGARLNIVQACAILDIGEMPH